MTTPKTTVQTDDASLTVERIFNTTPERLFQAWTDPALVGRWLAPGPMTCNVPVYEARPGGRFLIEMSGTGPDGKPMKMTYEGTFEHVVPGERVVMNWPPAMPSGEGTAPPSVVTVTFKRVAEGTLMRLTQDGFPSLDFTKGATMGWQSAFDKLAALV